MMLTMITMMMTTITPIIQNNNLGSGYRKWSHNMMTPRYIKYRLQRLVPLRRGVATAFGNTKPNVVLQNDVAQLLVACAVATASGPTKYDDAPTPAY